jgi:transposase
VVKAQLDDATRKRIRAGRLLQRGKGPAEIARELGVARQTVHTWRTILEEEGFDALRAVRGRGRPARLEPADLESLRRILLQSPTEQGFGTELWTLKRVAAVIQREHGVVYGLTQVWRILGTLGFSAQKPEKRAIERDEDAVKHWKARTWPALKKKPSGKAV